MAFLSYKCSVCQEEFEKLVKSFDEKVLCPKCNAPAVRSYSGKMYSATGKPVKKCSGNCKNCSGCS